MSTAGVRPLSDCEEAIVPPVAISNIFFIDTDLSDYNYFIRGRIVSYLGI